MTEEADEALDSIFQSVLAFIFYTQFAALQGSISYLSLGFFPVLISLPPKPHISIKTYSIHIIIAFLIFFVYFLFLENDVKGNKK